jgi:hypothetical protein
MSSSSDAKSAPSKTTCSVSTVVCRYAGTFLICERKEVLEIYVSPEDYTPFQELMPYIKWDGHFLESYPMRTNFTAPIKKKQDVMACMLKAGYVLKSSSSHTVADDGDSDL